MSNSMEKLFETGTPPSKDWFLQFLVNLANKGLLELDITLTVGGFLISGTLTGAQNYYEDLGTYFVGPFSEKENSRKFTETFQKIGEQCACISPSDKTDMPSYIHLKNAVFYTTGVKMPGVDAGTWWRGRLSEVQGFTLGKLMD